MKNLKLLSIIILLALLAGACTPSASGEEEKAPFLWENASVYFLLTDRFNNGDPSNDENFERSGQTAILRGFKGGDLAGVTQKLEEGYFSDLGITALWMTPWFEQNHGIVDEGTGRTYGYHGYWIQDWTALDPNFGTEEELARMINVAHSRGIRIVMDVVMNHTGPVTAEDPVWPDEWVRTRPACNFQNYDGTVHCTLVENLPDVLTGSDQEVELPAQLLEKWEAEGRLEQELDELDAFFAETGYPRAPRYYLIKWLTDYVRKYGIDGYRLDTAKHTEESIWSELAREASRNFARWKRENPEAVLDSTDFWMVGEVYNYVVAEGRFFDFGDRKVDFFARDIHSLINFQFKYDAGKSYEELFSYYSDILVGPLKGQGILNYISSHDDGGPFDKERLKPMEAATKLLLCPGGVQIYYGDESCRPLAAPGANGDAGLRSFMNWEEMEGRVHRNGFSIQKVKKHYARLGRFRREHPAVGAGLHSMLSEQPYVFSRSYQSESCNDRVVVGLDLSRGVKDLSVEGVFENGEELLDYYSGKEVKVKNGRVAVDSDFDIVLLGK